MPPALTDASDVRPALRMRVMLLALIIALVWWGAALLLRPTGMIIWHDQEHLFRASVRAISDPYTVNGFVHTPWVTLLLAPFNLLPLELSVLVQSCLYFVLMAEVILRMGGDGRAVALTLTSFTALNAVLEMNVDWFVLIGLVVPVTWSMPFLLLKPQLALGYYFGIPPRQWPRIIAVALVTSLLSLPVWGLWFFEILARVRTSSIERFFNVAPMDALTPYVSLPIGIVLAVLAYRRKSPPLGIVAWTFFTPYIAMYSLLLLFGIVATYTRRLSVIVWMAMWLIMGSIFLGAVTGVVYR